MGSRWRIECLSSQSPSPIWLKAIKAINKCRLNCFYNDEKVIVNWTIPFNANFLISVNKLANRKNIVKWTWGYRGKDGWASRYGGKTKRKKSRRDVPWLAWKLLYSLNLSIKVPTTMHSIQVDSIYIIMSTSSFCYVMLCLAITFHFFRIRCFRTAFMWLLILCPFNEYTDERQRRKRMISSGII